MNKIEILGIIASLFVIMCSVVKSHTIKGNIVMRILNVIGSILFIIYYVVLGAYSGILTNVIITILSIYYIIKLIVMLKNKNI